MEELRTARDPLSTLIGMQCSPKRCYKDYNDVGGF